jgi:hypothetical protein
MNAAQVKDYVETISGLDQGMPNVDTFFLAIIRVCQPGSDIARIQKSREKEHRGGEGADKKKAIHYSD